MWGFKLSRIILFISLCALLLAIFSTVALAQGLALVVNPQDDKARELLNSIFTPTTLVFVGAGVSWALGLRGDVGSSKKWFADYDYENVPRPLVLLIDGFLFVVIGAVIGIILYQPSNQTEGFAAGITWPTALAAYTGARERQIRDNQPETERTPERRSATSA